jgi:hypothetical protein
MRIHRHLIRAVFALVPIFGAGCSEGVKATKPTLGTAASRIVQAEADGTLGLAPTGLLSATTYDWRGSVALVAYKPFVKRQPDGSAKIDTRPAAESAQELAVQERAPQEPLPELWPDTPFVANERAVWQAGSGWLAAPDLFVTAAHVLPTGAPNSCENVAIVFTDGKPVEGTYDGSQVYGCSRVVGKGSWRGFDPDEEDWVVLQLDRPAAGRAPLPVGSLDPTQSVMTAGHPLGIRQHTSVAGVALPGAPGPQLMALSLTAISGQSGSPIVTNVGGSVQVVGMLVGSRSGDTFVNQPRLRPDGTTETHKTWNTASAQATRLAIGQGRVPAEYGFALATAGPVAAAIASHAYHPLGTGCADRLSAYLGNAASDAYTRPDRSSLSDPTLTSEWIWLRQGDRAHFQFGSKGDQAVIKIELHPRSRDQVARDLSVDLSEVDARMRASVAESGVFIRHWKAPVDGWYRAAINDVYGAAHSRGRVDFVARETFETAGDSACAPSSCFGAVGPDCQGVSVPDDVIASVQDVASRFSTRAELAIDFFAPHDIVPCRPLDNGIMECSANVGSEKHDSCCALNPNGFLCNADHNVLSNACRGEFIEAALGVGLREGWQVEYDPTDFWYIDERPLLADPATHAPRERNVMLAPHGTVIQKAQAEAGWCGTLATEDEIPEDFGVPRIPGVTDRKRCRNLIEWGDTTQYPMSAGSVAAEATGTGSRTLQAALLRGVPRRDTELGFEKWSNAGLNLTGSFAGFGLGPSGMVSGWNVQAVAPGTSDPVPPGTYLPSLSGLTRSFLKRYPSDAEALNAGEPLWRDGAASPLVAARVLDPIVTQNLVPWGGSEAVTVPIDVRSQILGATCTEDAVANQECNMSAATWTDDSKGTSFCLANRTDRPIRLYWIDYQGDPVGGNLYKPGETGCWGTADTHGFVVYGGGRCLGSFRATDPSYPSLFEVTAAPLTSNERHSCKTPPPPDPGAGAGGSGAGGGGGPGPECDIQCRCQHADGWYGPGCNN